MSGMTLQQKSHTENPINFLSQEKSSNMSIKGKGLLNAWRFSKWYTGSLMSGELVLMLIQC